MRERMRDITPRDRAERVISEIGPIRSQTKPGSKERDDLIPITIYLPRALYRALAAESDREGLNVEQSLRYAAQQWLKSRGNLSWASLDQLKRMGYK